MSGGEKDVMDELEEFLISKHVTGMARMVVDAHRYTCIRTYMKRDLICLSWPQIPADFLVCNTILSPSLLITHTAVLVDAAG